MILVYAILSNELSKGFFVMLTKNISFKKNGFTLVELLIVVAILGILAGIGIVGFGGFLGSAKEKATQANHKNVVNFMNARVTQCSIEKTIDLLDQNGNPVEFNCSEGAGNMQDAFVEHFRGSGFQNAHFPDQQAIDNAGGCGNLGVTNINNSDGNYIDVNTHYKEDEDCLTARILKE